MRMIIFALLLAISYAQTENCFASSINYAVCEGLEPQWRIRDQDRCERECCESETCDTWQFCTIPRGERPTRGCEGWEGAHCYHGRAESCKPATRKNNWVGSSKRAPGELLPITTNPATRKRGFAGRFESSDCYLAHHLELQDSWFYTWTGQTSHGNGCQYEGINGVDQAAEFTPMMLGAREEVLPQNMQQWKESWKRANVHYLLGYNEPDPSDFHPNEVDPYEAALFWPNLQHIAAQFDPPLILVAPSVSSADVDENGRSQWLDEFFQNCADVVEECDPDLIQYVAWHYYGDSVAELERKINGMNEIYGRPQWLTEFAYKKYSCRNPSTQEDHVKFMTEALPMLESNPNIFRYAWFTSYWPRETRPEWGWCMLGENALFEYDETQGHTLTSVGHYYMHAAESSEPNWQWEEYSGSADCGRMNALATFTTDSGDACNDGCAGFSYAAYDSESERCSCYQTCESSTSDTTYSIFQKAVLDEEIPSEFSWQNYMEDSVCHHRERVSRTQGVNSIEDCVQICEENIYASLRSNSVCQCYETCDVTLEDEGSLTYHFQEAATVVNHADYPMFTWKSYMTNQVCRHKERVSRTQSIASIDDCVAICDGNSYASLRSNSVCQCYDTCDKTLNDEGATTYHRFEEIECADDSEFRNDRGQDCDRIRKKLLSRGVPCSTEMQITYCCATCQDAQRNAEAAAIENFEYEQVLCPEGYEYNPDATFVDPEDGVEVFCNEANRACNLNNDCRINDEDPTTFFSTTECCS